MRVFPPPLDDRAIWEPIAATAIGREVVHLAEAHLREPIPHVSLADFAHYAATGERQAAEKRYRRRRDRLSQLTLAYALTERDAFLDAARAVLEAILAEPVWVFCAHDFDYPDRKPDPAFPSIDLVSAMSCHQLAETLVMLAGRFDEPLQTQVRDTVLHRGTDTWLRRPEQAWMVGRVSPNWRPVCAGAVGIATLLLEPDAARRSAVMALVRAGMESWFETFPADGGCLEGIGYWEKGVAYATMCGDVAERHGEWSPFADPRFKAVAAFPAQFALAPGIYPAFSDTGLSRTVQSALLHVLSKRLNLPDLARLDATPADERRLTTRFPGEQLRDLFWYDATLAPTRDTTLNLPAASVLPQSEIAVFRRPAIAVAIKGGFNAEPHNHNDVGSFVVHHAGAMPIAELGAPIYEKAFFAAGTRYGFLASGSHGHSVPIVNGQHQRPGKDARAHGFSHHSDREADTITMDLAAAYPLTADLRSLVRRLSIDGQGAEIILEDEAVFATRPGHMDSVLITLGNADVGDGVVLVSAGLSCLRVTFDPETLRVVADVQAAVALREGQRDVTRLIFSPRIGNALRARIRLHIQPV
jgi:hypothetical protein